MSDIAVGYGTSIPPRWAAKFKYPWFKLSPGNYFDWPNSLEAAQGAIKKRKKRHGETYRVAKVTEDGKHLIRVWRVG